MNKKRLPLLNKDVYFDVKKIIKYFFNFISKIGYCIVYSLSTMFKLKTHFILKLLTYCAPVVTILIFLSFMPYLSADKSLLENIKKEDNIKTDLIVEDNQCSDINQEEVVSSKLSPKNDETKPDIIKIDSQDGFAIFIDDEYYGNVLEKKTIEKMFEERLNYYRSQENLENIKFQKNIRYNPGTYPKDTFISVEEMLLKINDGNIEEKRYEIQQGDSLSLIALNNNITIEQLLKLNPEITDPNLCLPGQSLLIMKAYENNPIEYTKKVEKIIEVTYETTTEESNQISIGQSAVLSAGVNGKAKNIVQEKYLNNYKIGEDIIDSQIIVEPISEIIAIGTKQNKSNALPSQGSDLLDGTGVFMWPVDGGYISDYFGGARNHKGLDIGAPEGTSAFAAENGEVLASGWNMGGYGYFVMVNHSDGYATLYGHLSKLLVSNGQKVNKGDVIGQIGNTGDSYGSHLHFEVRLNAVCQDPALYLKTN